MTGFLVGLFAAILWLVVMVALGMAARGSSGSSLKSIQRFGALRRALGRDAARPQRVPVADGARGQGHARVIDLRDRRLNHPRRPASPPRPAGRSYVIDLTRAEPRVFERGDDPDDPELAALLASVRAGERASHGGSRPGASPALAAHRPAPASRNTPFQGHPLPNEGRRPSPTYLRRASTPSPASRGGRTGSSPNAAGLSSNAGRSRPAPPRELSLPSISLDQEGRPTFE